MLQLPPLSASYLAGLSDADRRYAVMVDKLLRQLLPLLQYPSYTTPDDVDADIAAHVAEADPHTQYLLETVAALTYQPLDSDLTAIAALATVSFGRGLLELGSGPAVLTYIGGQPLDATLTALAAYNTNGLLTQTAADTFTGRTLQAPAAGFSITNPAGVAGDPTFALANDLAALEGLASTGIPARTATDTWALRTIAVGSGLAIADAGGVAGNPTVTLDATLVSLAAFNTNGLLTQTAADTFTGRTLQAPAAGFTITNPAGIAGDPTFVLANDLAALEGLGSTGIAVRSAANTWVQRSVVAGTGISVTNGDGVSGNPTVALSTPLTVPNGGTGVSTLTG